MESFIGREPEREEFRQLLHKKTASLVVCQGRRRIGKSTLIHRCAREADHFLFFEGLPPREKIGREDQLKAFALRLAEQTAAPKVTLENWPQAFQLLSSVSPVSGSLVLLLDEISWMAMGEPDFAGYLKAAWDNQLSRRPRLLLVLCGSVSSWIQENILNNTGYVGRCSWQFTLSPLSLPQCNEFWRGKKVSAAEKLKILAVTGGVPRYLEEVNPVQTAEQNIQRLCFNRGGLLFHEFDQIFHDIFTRRAATYRKIIAPLADGPRTISEISQALDQERGGSLTLALEDLEAAGFIRREVSFDPLTGQTLPRMVRYRICDNYLRFYLYYVEPVREQIEKGIYHSTPLETLQAWDTIMGLQFENLVLANLETLLTKINLTRVPILNAGPYYQTQTQRKQGCQVDLLLRTKQSLYIFEVKLRKRIEKSVIEGVRLKVDRLKIPRSLSIRTGLLYQGELAPDIPQSDFFDFLVPFEDLLQRPERP